MQRYIVCAALLFCHNFNFSSEQPCKVKIEEPSRLCMGSSGNICGWKSFVGPLCVVGALGLLCRAWPNGNARALYDVVECSKNRETVQDPICPALSVDGKNNQPAVQKNQDLTLCSLTGAEQAAALRFAVQPSQKREGRKLRKYHVEVVGNGIYRKRNKKK